MPFQDLNVKEDVLGSEEDLNRFIADSSEEAVIMAQANQANRTAVNNRVVRVSVADHHHFDSSNESVPVLKQEVSMPMVNYDVFAHLAIEPNEEVKGENYLVSMAMCSMLVSVVPVWVQKDLYLHSAEKGSSDNVETSDRGSFKNA